MRTDTLHFSSDMLRIAGTPSIPTQDNLPLASQRCHQLAGYLQDETRHGGQLLDNGAMLVQRFGDLHLQVHPPNPFFHNALGTLFGVRGDNQIIMATITKLRQCQPRAWQITTSWPCQREDI